MEQTILTEADKIEDQSQENSRDESEIQSQDYAEDEAEIKVKVPEFHQTFASFTIDDVSALDPNFKKQILICRLPNEKELKKDQRLDPQQNYYFVQSSITAKSTIAFTTATNITNPKSHHTEQSSSPDGSEDSNPSDDQLNSMANSILPNEVEPHDAHTNGSSNINKGTD